MKLHVFRNLYLANRSLLQAVNALAELVKETSPCRTTLRHAQAMIEEVRAGINSDVAEWIEQRESGRFSSLDLARGKCEKENESPASAKAKPSKRRRSS
ncbi:MAG: hypothetical protein LAO20_18395 [Acidobacteriia bacterium]|nr:hypothetical protein [Terriglobia bacterium]